MTCAGGDGTNFLVLNKRSAWEEGQVEDLLVSDVGLALLPAARYVASELSGQQLPGGLAVTDLAVGECNLVYILDAANHVLATYDPGTARLERIVPVSAWLGTQSSVAFSPNTLFIGSAVDSQRITALALSNWQTRWTVGPDATGTDRDSAGEALGLPLPFAPVDLAVDSEGFVYALDATNLAILKFDPAGHLRAVLAAAGLAETQPSGLAALPNGALLVLDVADRAVRRFAPDGQLADPRWIDFAAGIAQGDLPAGFVPAGLAVDRAGQVCVGDARTLVPGDEDNRFLRMYDETGRYRAAISAFQGHADVLTIDRADRIFVFDGERRRLVILEPRATFLQPGTAPPPSGLYRSHALDSTAPGTRWHSVAVDATIPPNTQVQLSYYVSDEPGAAPGPSDVRWSYPLVNPQEALIDGTGRYLWLRVRLIGSDADTPEIRCIQVHFPRTSYLRYLPAVYQEDAASRDFLERFLSLFETLFVGVERQIDHVVRYFDPGAISGEFLRWLATWLGVVTDGGWPDDKLRILLQRAPDLYRARGTRSGLEAMIEILTGERPLIVEQFQLRCAAPALRPVYQRLYGADPYSFCVLLKPSSVGSEDDRQVVARLVEAEKPAHTAAGVTVLQPWIYLDMHTYLEINTFLTEPSPRLDTGAVIGRDTLLTDIETAGQIERKSRLALDATLA